MCFRRPSFRQTARMAPCISCVAFDGVAILGLSTIARRATVEVRHPCCARRNSQNEAWGPLWISAEQDYRRI
jgi:hypothetical protein